MKDFFKYALFFHKLTDGKIYLYGMLSLFSVAFEGISLLSLVPIMEMGVANPGKYSRFIYQILFDFGLHEQKQQLLALLIFITLSFFFAGLGMILTTIYSAKLQTFLLNKVQMEMNRK